MCPNNGRLPVLEIFNVHTDVDACSCTQGLYNHRKIVCIGSSFWEQNPLLHWGPEAMSVYCTWFFSQMFFQLSCPLPCMLVLAGITPGGPLMDGQFFFSVLFYNNKCVFQRPFLFRLPAVHCITRNLPDIFSQLRPMFAIAAYTQRWDTTELKDVQSHRQC